VIDTIYLDVDGVLADFAGETLRRYDFDPADYPRGEYNMSKVLGVTDDDLWAKLDTFEFWNNLPVLESGKHIFRVVYSMAITHGIPFKILTSYPKDRPEPFKTARRVWLKKHGYFDLVDKVIFNRDKAQFATPTSLLIDDNDRNIKLFRNAGGMTYQIPGYWNQLHELEITIDMRAEAEILSRVMNAMYYFTQRKTEIE